MDQPEAAIAFTILFIEFFEIVEQNVVRFVADGMDRELEPGAIGVEHVAKKLPFNKLAFVVNHQWSPAATVVRIVGVRFEETRTACAHNPINVALERAESNPFVT